MEAMAFATGVLTSDPATMQISATAERPPTAATCFTTHEAAAADAVFVTASAEVARPRHEPSAASTFLVVASGLATLRHVVLDARGARTEDDADDDEPNRTERTP